MKKLDRDELRRLYGPVPGDLKYKVSKLLTSEQTEREEKHMSKKKILTLTVAAALLLSFTAALASGAFGNLFRLNYTHGLKPLDGADKLVSTAIGSVEDEFIRLSVEEAVYDGRGAMVLLRVSAVDPDKYAIASPDILDYPPDEYEYVDVPARRMVGEDARLEFTQADGSVYVRPTYEEDGVRYYADVIERNFVRKDGKEFLSAFTSVSMVGAGEQYTDDRDFADAEGMHAPLDAWFLDVWDGEAQSDGSVLIIGKGFAAETLEGDLTFRAKCVYLINGDPEQKRETPEIEFVLERVGATQSARLVPAEGTLRDVEIIEGDMYFTPVNGYLTLTYADRYTPNGYSDLYWIISLPDGTRLMDGDSTGEFTGDGAIRTRIELQALGTLPEYLYLEAISWDGGEDASRGKIRCDLIK